MMFGMFAAWPQLMFRFWTGAFMWPEIPEKDGDHAA